jgi:hypothetical protein
MNDARSANDKNPCASTAYQTPAPLDKKEVHKPQKHMR